MAQIKRKRQFVFDRLLRNANAAGISARKGKQSMDWFREKAHKVSDTRKRYIEDAKRAGRNAPVMELGSMYFMGYEDPKYRESLPYWDAFPLVIPFSKRGHLIYAINLHHCQPKIRALIMDSLYDLATDEKMGKRTKMAISYDIITSLSRSKYIKPLIRSYIISRISTVPSKVLAAEWGFSIFLPYADYRKQGAQKVFADYRKMVAKG